MNHLIIRADASPSIGVGHLMRCTALAQAWKKHGGQVTFISHCPDSRLSSRIASEKFQRISLGTPDRDPGLLIDHAHRLLHSKTTLDQNRKNWIVLDGYHFTADYQKQIMENGFNLLVIDDTSHLTRYHADIILNQNMNSDHYLYDCPANTVKLLGTRYVMLRTLFLETDRPEKRPPPTAENILVTLGGSDPENFTSQILDAVATIDDQNLKFHIVLGPSNPNITSIKNRYQNRNTHFYFIENGDMPYLMAQADLAITAGGSTCWELCFMGVPILGIAIADNQKNLLAGLKNAGAAKILCQKETISNKDIIGRIRRMIGNLDERDKMIKAGRRLVDGKGTKRIIRRMLLGKMALRPARSDDTSLLFEWVNEKETRANSFSLEPVSWVRHLDWFTKKHKDKNCKIIIAETQDGIPMGMIRFDREADIFQISYLVDREYRGLGLGKRILLAGSNKIQTEINVPVILQGKVKNKNRASCNTFINSDFEIIDTITAGPDDETHFVFQKKLFPKKVTEAE